MKLKDLSALGDIYGEIAKTLTPEQQAATRASASQDILLTDATQYVPQGKQVNAGSPLGGGPGTKGEVTEVADKTGPAGLKGNDFKKVDKDADPGSDASTMKKEADGTEEESKENEFKKEGAKFTVAKEKIKESAAENTKYNYNPRITMSKPKFEQLYEQALNRMPFKEDMEDAEGVPTTPPEDTAGPASDAEADAAGEMDKDLGTEEEEPMTPLEMIECLEKVLKSLKKHEGSEGDITPDEAGKGDELAALDGNEDGEPPVAEAIDAEDEGDPLTKPNGSLKKGNPDSVNKPVVVGTLKKSGGTADKGKLRNEPEPKEVEGDESALHGNKNKLQNIKNFKADGSGTVMTPGKTLFAEKRR